jgi:hypothetical protein
MMENKYSQNGEELLVLELLHLTDQEKPGGVLVEFGGSKGKDNSNLFAAGEQGRNLILIERDSKRFSVLSATIREYPSIRGIQAAVGYSHPPTRGGGEILGTILKNNGVDPHDCSVVSIDIDSDDAAVFENLGISPELVIVEFNPSFPADSCFRNPEGTAMGNSAGELMRVGRSLGMYLVGVFPTNLVFMKESYRDRVPELDLWTELERHDLPRFGLGYDGTVVRYHTSGRTSIAEIYHNGWNDTFIRQPTPPRLRRYSQSERWARLLHFVATGLIIQPISTLKLVHRFLTQRSRLKS